jgi:hypothetical protein
MEKITQCQHDKRRKNGRSNFCQQCGSIVFGSVKNEYNKIDRGTKTLKILLFRRAVSHHFVR